MTAYFISNAATGAFMTASFQCASVLTVTCPCTCKSEQALSETHKLKHTEHIHQAGSSVNDVITHNDVILSVSCNCSVRTSCISGVTSYYYMCAITPGLQYYSRIAILLQELRYFSRIAISLQD
jgi:hypothetical protein